MGLQENHISEKIQLYAQERMQWLSSSLFLLLPACSWKKITDFNGTNTHLLGMF